MTPSEERWVSACLLAHVNYFGKHVLVSMRAIPPPVPALAVAADEQQTFTMFEGGFFGNLFTPEPVAYACQGAREPAQARDPIFQERICTQETGETTAEGTPITACRFLLTGRCEDPASVRVHGTLYTEVIFTYLRPASVSELVEAPLGQLWPSLHSALKAYARTRHDARYGLAKEEDMRMQRRPMLTGGMDRQSKRYGHVPTPARAILASSHTFPPVRARLQRTIERRPCDAAPFGTPPPETTLRTWRCRRVQHVWPPAGQAPPDGVG